MNTREIEQIILNYEAGETTLAEEQALRQFFAGNNVPAELEAYRHLFSFFHEEGREEITNPGFDRALFEKLSDEEGKVVNMVPRRTRLFYIASLAAAITLLIGVAVTLVLNGTSRSRYSTGEKLAYEQAEEALMIVSSNLNCGISQVRYLEAFDKGMEQMQMLSKFYQYQSLIINPEPVQPPSDKTHN